MTNRLQDILLVTSDNYIDSQIVISQINGKKYQICLPSVIFVISLKALTSPDIETTDTRTFPLNVWIASNRSKSQVEMEPSTQMISLLPSDSTVLHFKN